MIKTVWGSAKQPVASAQLSFLLEQEELLDGTLYIGYPIIGTPEGPFAIDAVLVSPSAGLIAFNIIEGKNLEDFESHQDEAHSKLQSKLLQYKNLVVKKNLGVELTVITFAPAVLNASQYGSDEYLVTDSTNLVTTIKNISWSHSDLFPALVSAIQSISTIRKGKKRKEVANSNSKGSKIRALEESIANLDSQQSAAVIETAEGVQRIRGLAGSGKTIVLALKVAYLHAQHPEWKIAITFNTRSLKGHLERLINTFVIEQTNEEPDWSQIDVINAWGSPGDKSRSGIYYKFCTTNNITYYDYKSAAAKYGGPNKAFEGACNQALTELASAKEYYDIILIDEAQDLPPQFLRLCYELLKQPKRLVYAYDELQSLTDNSLPSPEEIFGSDADGNPRVTFFLPEPGKPKQDIILEKCYRNSRPVLSTAHALGFGIYRQPDGLIQIFDRNDLWLDVGYVVDDGRLEDGQFVALKRTENSSPRFLEDHSELDDLIQFICFDTFKDQNEWLVKEIEINITEDELMPEDVIVINPNPLSTRNAVADARAMLFKKEINSTLAGVSNSPDVFFESGAVTFTGIFRAKGNEAAMVYVINAQDCYSSFLPSDLAKARNQLFTAITRSKGWVRVLGVGDEMKKLAAEFNEIKRKKFNLEFVYPTAAQREKLRVINRDMSAEEKDRLKKRLTEVNDLVESLEMGETNLEDLPESVRDRLIQLLLGKPKK